MPMPDARVLVVEDNEEVAEMLVIFFGSRGLKVTVAADGSTALRQIRDSLPTLILLDVGLPDIDGYDLFRQFRQSVRTRFIPVIFLTAKSQEAEIQRGLSLGAAGYVTKPFDALTLGQHVKDIVRKINP